MPLPTSSRSHAITLVAAALLAVAAFSAPLGAPLGAQEPAPTDSAALAAKQVELGEQWYRAVCMECHKEGTLANGDFRLKWTGRSAFDLFETIRSTMPESDPGSLTTGTYTAVVSYLMKLNGMPVGTTALPADSAGLAAVKLTFAPAVPAFTPRR